MENDYNLSMDDAVKLFEEAYSANNLVKNNQRLLTKNPLLFGSPFNFIRLPHQNFYCGITNDIDRRESEHNATFLTWVKARNVKLAIDLEKKLGELGFDIGSNAGNGATDDSVYVYIYKKIPGVTKEHLTIN